ncbi:RnfABCDGE type electron transport complex subunit B [Bacteroidales bacterium OttesenSCG-928-K03]|nr:RnfABCDGE type electron transport complex subunit B [Odoribacter sp. OttesenSCG-928-L07]MDL2239856.1 RnfABCDGE type electron transport complex subunit B [Bacteroidales bacterium OttesenSCG-928-L14]MDL2243080.1 RnfABCDGE type electron transport complex subunit B [Bacteroidales bacterium OttesenSCG-928-K03]
MNSILIVSVVVLTLIGVVSAIILYIAAKKFYVKEDERIPVVLELLPGANCGGCGFTGCKALVEAMIAKGDMTGFSCPGAGNETMDKIAEILGLVAEKTEPKIAVVRCSGSREHAKQKLAYEGISSCSFANSISVGESGCKYGCLGYGDCVTSCKFDAIYIDEETGLPVVSEEKCTSCGVCAKSCPRHIIEIRKRGPKNRRVFVSCINEEKGAAAKKNCEVACIGCSKCVKVCTFEAITISNNLAYIDPDKCKLCLKCVSECPTGAILSVNFPPKKIVEQPAAKTEVVDVIKDNVIGDVVIEKIETKVEDK